MAQKMSVGSRGSVEDYIYELVELFTRGANRVVLYAVGENECKLVDIVARLSDYLPGRIRIASAEIGSRRVRGERKSYIQIELEYEPPL